jgi:23S rRNA pseudouridine1911/1915/1917 synthase
MPNNSINVPESDSHTVTITVEAQSTAVRLDRYLAARSELELSRTKIQKMVVSGDVTVDGAPVAAKHLLMGGETVQLAIVPEPVIDLAPENIPIEIMFEDQYLAVVNKPAGMVTHPAPGNYRGTLVNALAHHFIRLAAVSGADRPGIVHRLDKNTTGLLVVAKDDVTYRKLQEAIQNRSLKRIYQALICGHVKNDEGQISLPIGRSTRDRKKMTVTDRNSREAVTEFRLTERYRSFDLLEVSLQTGRTHQIRVHFAHLGHPVFGDPDYGGRHKWLRGVFAPERPLFQELLLLLERQALHAARLVFTHPVTGEPIACEAPLPPDFRSVLDLLDQRGH